MIYGIVLLGILYGSVAFAQQPLSSVQQCTNHQQELVLSDIILQELRARCGNIMRQAYELEAEIKQLKDENAKLKDENAKLKAEGVKLQPPSVEIRDVPAKSE